MARKSNDVTLNEAIQNMLQSYQLADKIQLSDLKTNWEKLFGKTMAKYSRPISLSKNELKIYVEQAPLKSQLNYNKQKAINIINEYFKTEVVKNIIVV